MRNKNLREKIINATLGIFATAIDLVLFTIFTMGEVAFNPGDSYSMLKLQKRLGRLFLKDRDRIIRNAIRNARPRGWIQKDGKLTEEGKKRFRNLLPVFLPSKKWSGKWYLAIFDIPEKIRRRRDILRENLKRLGLGNFRLAFGFRQ